MKTHILAFCLFVSSLSTLIAQEQFIPPRPEHFTPIVDSAQVLSVEQEAALTQKIKRFEDSTGTQVAVVILSSLHGYTVEGYAVEWFKKWQYGQQKNNNGVLLLAAITDHKVHIETGYGLEGAIPDAYAKRIIETDIKPNFKAGNYYQGIDASVDNLIRLASGESYEKEESESGPSWVLYVIFIPIGIFAIVFVVMFVIEWRRSGKQAQMTLSSKGTKYSSKKNKNTPKQNLGSSYSDYSDKYSDYSDKYSDYSDKYSDYSDSYSDYSDSSGGSSGGGGASGDW
jgi:uncharacterized protein